MNRKWLGKKFQTGNVYFANRARGLFLSVYVDDIKMVGKKQNLDPMRKILMKEVDLGEPTLFLDHVYLGFTQRECQISRDIVDNYRNTIPPEINSNDFGGFWSKLADSNSIFVVAEILFFFERFEYWCDQSSFIHNAAVHVHVLWPVCTHAIPFRILWRP